ncbi:DUF775-domain-containing protein [Ceratobasidium sp. AG-I]|nr:DUF775-domain-containing protein [Ceratobasidium sp. AG-I]
MFGICVAGRLLQTEFQQVDETHAAFTIDAASNVNHICVFMLGTVPFPPGFAATVHFHWPGKGFQLLGTYVQKCFMFYLTPSPLSISVEKTSAVIRIDALMLPCRLSNEKPSAVFRLRGTYSPAQHQSHSTISSAVAIDNPAPTSDVTAILGIAVEPIQVVEAQISANSANTSQSTDNRLVKAAAGGLSDPAILAEKIVKHMFTYLSSFIADPRSMSPDTVVPLNIIRKWYDNFLIKVRSGGVGFLENQD